VIWSLITYKKSLKMSRGVIRICKSKKNRQHNGQKKKTQLDKQRSTKHTYKTKDRNDNYVEPEKISKSLS
jgi:hypothetical protein